MDEIDKLKERLEAEVWDMSKWKYLELWQLPCSVEGCNEPCMYSEADKAFVCDEHKKTPRTLRGGRGNFTKVLPRNCYETLN